MKIKGSFVNIKQRINNLPQKIKFIRFIQQKLLIILCLIFVFLCVFLYFINRYHNLLITDYGYNDSFLISFEASLLEDLLFFAFIGIVLLIDSYKLLEDEDLEIKINAICNGDSCNTNVKSYFTEKIGLYLTHINDLNIKIAITDHNKQDKYVKIYMYYNGNIFNLSKDMDISTIVNSYAVSDTKVNNYYGEIKLLQISDSSDNLLVDDFKSYYLQDNNEFQKQHTTTIKANDYIKHNYNFWVWNKTNDNFIIATERFISNLNIEIQNDTNLKISYARLNDVNEQFYKGKIDDIKTKDIQNNEKINEKNLGKDDTIILKIN